MDGINYDLTARRKDDLRTHHICRQGGVRFRINSNEWSGLIEIRPKLDQFRSIL